MSEWACKTQDDSKGVRTRVCDSFYDVVCVFYQERFEQAGRGAAWWWSTTHATLQLHVPADEGIKVLTTTTVFHKSAKS